MTVPDRHKFRAWDFKNKKMYYNVVIDREGIPTHPDAPNAYYLDHSMQSTGLIDCNSTEIFEGDILTGRIEKWGYLVLWDKDMGAWIGKRHDWHEEWKNKGFNAVSAHEFKWMKIVGNQFENPELLEGEQ